MATLLTGQFRYTVDELLTALRWHFRRKRRRTAAMLSVYACFALVGAFLVWSFGFDNSLGVVSLALGLGYWAYWFLVRPRRLRSYAERVLQQMSVRDQKVRWELSSEGLACADPNSSTSFNWVSVYEAVETPDGLLLFMNEGIFHWLPSHAFERATWKAVVELTASQVRKFSTLCPA